MSIFLLIVVIPFAIVLVGFLKPDLVEQIIREPSGSKYAVQSRPVEQPTRTTTP